MDFLRAILLEKETGKTRLVVQNKIDECYVSELEQLLDKVKMRREK